MKPYRAFCWASGLIQFDDQVPEGAIELCHGTRTAVVREVTVAARHGTEHAAASIEVDREIATATACSRRLVPVLLDSQPLPAALTDVHAVEWR